MAGDAFNVKIQSAASRLSLACRLVRDHGTHTTTIAPTALCARLEAYEQRERSLSDPLPCAAVGALLRSIPKYFWNSI
jgi:hypothetical protein